MRLAWFRPETHLSDRLDDTAALIRTLESEHQIHIVDEARAHDFIRLDFRSPFDLCVYELADTPHHAYIWPYLLHVPGVLRLRSLSLHESRTQALRRRDRDLASELAFSDWDLAGAPIVGSRITVVSDAPAAARLQRHYPSAAIRFAPLGLGSGPHQGSGIGDRGSRALDPGSQIPEPCLAEGGLTLVGSLDVARRGVVQRAAARARDAGARIEVIADASAERVLEDADVIVAMSWPPADETTLALAGLAAGKAVVVFEAAHTAGWPALDPQTWRLRGWTADRPVVVSVDPRDEEHSLSLALRRLANDSSLRSELGTTARAWWHQNATVDHAARAWRSIIDEAATLTPPQRPVNWPRHLTADGTERAREILGELAVSVDFLRTEERAGS
jgi:hypothetical protein